MYKHAFIKYVPKKLLIIFIFQNYIIELKTIGNWYSIKVLSLIT